MMASEEDRGERDASGRPTGPLPRRESVADGTRRYIDARPSVRDSLLYDIVNFTALARRIRRETNLGSQEAIEIACRRYRRQMENEESREEQLRNVVRQSHVELRTHVASLTIRGDLEFLSRLGASLERSVPPRARILQLFEGSGSVTILCDENFLPSLLAAVPRDSVISVRRRLSIVSIRSPEEVIVTPRILSFLADAFGRWGINCEEMTSVYTDTHFALKASDALRAFEILSELTRAAAGPSAELPETEGRPRSSGPPPARSAAGARAVKRGRR